MAPVPAVSPAPLDRVESDRLFVRTGGQVFCRICGSSRTTMVIRRLRDTRFSVLRCRVCATERLHPQPSRDEIRSLYSADYYQSWNMRDGEKPVVAEMKKDTFRRHLRLLAGLVSPAKILDVGTATGFFLEVARDAGFDPYGVELSAYSGAIAAQKFAAGRIHIGTLETAPFPAGMFSAVAMSDLLEHVPDPLETLARARRLLSPRGVLMITTPDCQSFSRKIMGRRWTHYKVEHLFYPNRSSIELMADKCGFRVLHAERARKAMSLAYLHSQFQTYRHWALTPLAALASTVAQGWAHRHFTIPMGELLVFLGKAA